MWEVSASLVFLLPPAPIRLPSLLAAPALLPICVVSSGRQGIAPPGSGGLEPQAWCPCLCPVTPCCTRTTCQPPAPEGCRSGSPPRRSPECGIASAKLDPAWRAGPLEGPADPAPPSWLTCLPCFLLSPQRPAGLSRRQEGTF